MGTQTTASATADNVFSLAIRNDGIAVITIDVPGESMNVLRAEVMEQAPVLFDELERNDQIRGVVFISGKADSFIAGADVHMLAASRSAQEATELSRAGQALFDRLEHFRVPVVAAIHGICLGGGLELAMACRGRVASNDPKTTMGLPEVKLGLLPGSGGTQRLPKLTGIQAALDLMLTGRQVNADRARHLGLVHDVVPRTILLDAAVKLIGELAAGTAPGGRRATLQSRLLEDNPLGRRFLFDQARKQTEARTRGNYPAAPAIIACVETGISEGRKRGLELEARRFGELAMTPQARQLMQLYFATVAMKKGSGTDTEAQPRKVNRVGVLGAGLMGAGISLVTASRAGMPVRLKDVSTDGLSKGMQYVDTRIGERVKRRSISPFDGKLQLNRVTPTLDFSGFGRVDLVIEAVFEDVELKHGMIRDIEAHCPEHTIFASNTSSIPIAELAEAAKRPENVVGMHYFSPVEKMPLLEVIATDRTAPDVIATAVHVGRQQGKTVIVVRDGAGFYVNRILGPYINEASHLLREGVAIDRIDKSLVDFGFPVGPFALLDEVGLDVSAKVGGILHQAFGERMQPAGAESVLLEDGRHGKKSNKGFYVYGGKKRKGGKQVDEAVYTLLDVQPSSAMDASEIIDRTVFMMLNEAARCLQEGVIRSARDGDIGAIFGIGFPPFLGGPFRYMDSYGIDRLVQRLEELQQRHGDRFAPTALLRQMAGSGKPFHDT
ncbi:MAG: fatty acid oxidation complex subunit alpha FadJ [Aquisalimonadaceae bacterium]